MAKLSKKDKAALKQQKAQEKEIIARRKSFQDRLPISQIADRLYVTKNNEYFPVFSLGQKAIDLMSEDEVYTFSRQLESAFETMDMYQIQILLLPVPFDLAPYEKNMEDRRHQLRKEKDAIERKMLNSEDLTIEEKRDILNDLKQIEYSMVYVDNQQRFAERFMQSGRVANKHCYIVPVSKDRWNKTTVQEMARIVENTLKNIAPDSRRCSETEMQKILVEIYNPLRPEIYINY